MRPVEGTITDPNMDRLLEGLAPLKEQDDVVEILSLDSYQKQAETTAIYPRVYTEDQVKEMLCVAHELWTLAEPPYDRDEAVDYLLDSRETEFSRLVYPVLGLLGEAGEIGNKLKKVARDQKGQWEPDLTQDYVAELGDVTWYVAAIATGLKTKLGDVGRKNLDKLFSRKERGTLGGSGDNR